MSYVDTFISKICLYVGISTVDTSMSKIHVGMHAALLPTLAALFLAFKACGMRSLLMLHLESTLVLLA